MWKTKKGDVALYSCSYRMELLKILFERPLICVCMYMCINIIYNFFKQEKIGR